RRPTCVSPRAPDGDGNRGELRGALAMTIADVFMAADPRIAEAARPVADWLARAPREEVVAGLAAAAEPGAALPAPARLLGAGDAPPRAGQVAPPPPLPGGRPAPATTLPA